MKRALYILILIFACNVLFGRQQDKVSLGIDELIKSNFNYLKGKKVALLTNQSGRTGDAKLTADVFIDQNVFKFVAIFSPEHGLFGAIPAGAKVDNEKYRDIPVLSVYGAAKSPENSALSKVDIVVIDIQDIGIRSYTYLSSMYNMMQACAKANKHVIVLDRPNPLGGIIVDGNTLEKGRESFVGIIPVSYIHGCTIGELARMINEEQWLGEDKNGKQLKCKLTIIKMKGWFRKMQWEQTGFLWFPTSPHIPSVDAIRGSAVLGSFGELGFISIGIGTTLPFQYLGSPGLNSDSLLIYLEDEYDNGLHLFKAKYKPFYAKYSGEYCDGLLLKFSYNNDFAPYSEGFKIILALKKLYPELFKKDRIAKNSQEMFKKVTGSNKIIELLFGKNDDDEVLTAIEEGKNEYLEIRGKYLLYE